MEKTTVRQHERTKKSRPPKHRFPLRLEQSLWEKLELMADDFGISINTLINEAVEDLTNKPKYL